MKVSARVIKDWENRFPPLSGKWTHWKITGDGALLGIVDYENLSLALEIVKQNYGRFSSIRASRATADENSKIREEENHTTEISSFINEEIARRAAQGNEESQGPGAE